MVFNGTNSAWTITDPIRIQAPNATSTLVIKQGTVTLGDGPNDDMEVLGGFVVGDGSGYATFTTAAINNASGTITININASSSPINCPRCTIWVASSTANATSTFELKKNSILKFNSYSSVQSGLQLEPQGYLHIEGSQDATNTVSSVQEDNSSTTITAFTSFGTNNYTGMHLRIMSTASSTTAIGKIYDIATNTASTIKINATTTPTSSISSLTVTNASSTRTICAAITNNLWTSASQSGMPQDLIYALGDIFASTVDFRHFNKGDQFMVTFEERFIQDKYVGTGKIKAAQIICCNKTFQAFAFENNGVTGFYDEAGNSLEKSFLKCPLKYSRISSKFTNRRLHPIKQKYIAHPGIDYAAPRGTPVRSVGDGIITFMGYAKSAGNYIKIRHAGFGTSEYMHLSKFHARLKKNQKVKKGQIIGYVGSTGYATGPHLDLRFKKNGRYVDYSKMDLPTGNALEKSNKKIFMKQVAMIKKTWDHENRLTLNLPEPDKDMEIDTQPVARTIN